MNLQAQQLWQRLLDLLRGEGELPLRYETMTPGEIARDFRRRHADERVERFIWKYYYPCHYGEEPGMLSDAEALELVESFVKKPILAAPDLPDKPDATNPPRQQCAVCGVRPARSRSA